MKEDTYILFTTIISSVDYTVQTSFYLLFEDKDQVPDTGHSSLDGIGLSWDIPL